MLYTLGCCDPGARPPDLPAYFGLHHEGGMGPRFRAEENARYEDLRESAEGVRRLQTRLREAGFMPHAPADGIFGYVTLSAVRLFQEHVRTVEGRPDIGTPDGLVGPKTLGHLDRWAAAGRRAAWAGPDTAGQHARWLALLERHRQRMLAVPTPLLRQVAAHPRPSDTLAPAAWRYDDPAAIHLVGIRRGAGDRAGAGGARRNDDVFVLLVGGLVFTFYGSTDPTLHPGIMDKRNEPYLVPAQHRYRFGWHMVSKTDRVYRAFRPAGPGVLVVRDRNGSDTLDPADTLDPTPNPTINIHWSGVGTTNWSAGCMVVAGARYGNARGETIDCRGFAAANYSGLGAKTRGAFNVLVDLVATHAERCQVRNGTVMLLTLVDERDVNADPALAGFAAATLARLSA